jgi:hypothetical protein
MCGRWGCGRVLGEHDEHPSEDQGKRWRAPVCNRSVREENADDRRAQQEDSAERKHDSKSPGGEAELAP